MMAKEKHDIYQKKYHYKHGLTLIIGGATIARGDEIWEDEFDFIVRACNSHYKLLEACKTCMEFFEPNDSVPDDIRDQIREMIQRDPRCQRVKQAIAAVEGAE